MYVCTSGCDMLSHLSLQLRQHTVDPPLRRPLTSPALTPRLKARYGFSVPPPSGRIGKGLTRPYAAPKHRLELVSIEWHVLLVPFPIPGCCTSTTPRYERRPFLDQEASCGPATTSRELPHKILPWSSSTPNESSPQTSTSTIT